MCGIGAFQLVESEVRFARPLCQALLRELEVRGAHASGIAWHENENNKTWVQKSAQRGSLLARVIDQEVGSTCIVHTRYATQGSPADNNNNHPIDVGGMVGVHNGHVSNDNALIAKLSGYTRKGKVDSEAAFAYLQHGPKSDGLSGRLSKIKGGAALIWLNSEGPRKLLHIARLRTSPLCFAHTKAGSVIVASTEHILRTACKQAGLEIDKVTHLDEGVYVRFEKGALIQMGDIPLPEQPTPVLPSYAPAKSSAGSYQNGVYRSKLDIYLDELEELELREMENAMWKDGE